MFSRSLKIGVIATILIFAVGCVKPYTILQPLEEPIDRPATIQLGDISDKLPLDTPDDNKLNPDDIAKFRSALQKHLLKSGIFIMADSGSSAHAYEVRGSITGLVRGNGFSRFFIMFSRPAQLNAHLELVKKSDNRIVFSGDFRGMVASAFQSGAAMYDKTAKAFSNEIKKQYQGRFTTGSSSKR
jgi:hypothetical protein